MTDQEKIAFLKNLAAPHTQVNMQRVSNSGTFDPRPVFSNKAVNALFPIVATILPMTEATPPMRR